MIHCDADRTVPVGASGLRPALADLQATIVEGAAERLRPKFMTVATMFVGLIPIMWATGTGSDVWKHRRADGWRHLYLIRPQARSGPGDLRNLEVTSS